MNKKILLIFSVLFIMVVPLVFGQDFLQDYLFQAEKYREAYTDFTTSRDKYLKYQDLTAKQAAIQATKTIILQRNQVLRTYFLALKDKLKYTPGVIEKQGGESLTSQLDKKIIWLEAQSSEVDKLTLPTLNDLFVLSDRIENKKAEINQVAYLTLTEVILGKIRTLHQTSVANTSALKDRVNQGQEATQAAQLNLWLKEVELKNYLAQKEIEVAEFSQIQLGSNQDEQGMVNLFNNVLTSADQAKLSLTEALSFQNEILGVIQNE